MKLFGYEINKAVVPVEDVSKAAGKPKVSQSPMGIVGMKTSSGFVEEEFLSELRWPAAGKVYQEMLSNDAVVGGCLYLIETLIRQANWHVKPATSETGDTGDAANIEAASFLESCMFDMQEQTWDDFICEVLSMLPYGFSFHEVIYKVRRGPQEKDLKFKSNYTDGKIGWQELPVRSQASLSEWTIDPTTGKVLEFIQDPGIVGSQGAVKKIPLEGNLLFRTKQSRNNPEGWSILRRAYRSWFFKRYIEELEGIGIERSLAGIPILAPPPDVMLFDKENPEMVTMLNWSQRLVNELRQDRNHGIVLPSTDWQLKLLGSEGAAKAMDTDNVIRRHETRIAMSMLADIVLMGTDRTGSFALAETKQTLFVASLQAIINSIANTLNTYAVPKLFAVNNWNLEKLPKIVADNIEAPSVKEVALLLRSLKIDVTKNKKMFNYLMELMQAPTMTDEEFNTFMAEQQAATETENTPGENPDDYQDTAENDAKQSDEAYV